jgi:poly(A) polymerase Pap1
MMEEFTKAAESVAELLLTAEVDWSRLFEPYPFFSLFKNFLQVSCSPSSRCISHGGTVSVLCVSGGLAMRWMVLCDICFGL